MKIDKRTVEQIRYGDRKTIEYVYSSYYKLVKYKVYEMLNNNEDADDITQEVFVKVFKNIEKYDTKQNFNSWILAITKNTCLDYLKIKRVNIEYGDNFSDISDAEEATHGDDLDDKIKRLLSEEEYTIVIML